MTVPEIVGILLTVAGLAFAFEAPRHWFLRITRLRRVHPTDLPLPEPVGAPRNNGRQAPAIQGTAIDATPIAPSITVQEIVDAINAAPPLQQEELSQHYTGVAVQWVGYLRRAEADPSDKNRVRVNLIVDRSRIVSYSFWFSERLERVPEMKTLKMNSRLRVKGKIVSASGAGLSVNVEPDEIEILERGREGLQSDA
jgi:hypothetical protein